MESSRLAQALESRAVVAAACAVSFALGIVFVFVWAPHPWGREGFDHYHELALTLASGRPFPTMEVPWGYAYFLAGFYRLFGDRPVVPVLVQVGINALLPWMVFRLAQSFFTRRIAAVAALLTGFLSFNTVYASTQSSDAICTVLFIAALLAFARARRSAAGRPDQNDSSARGWFALTGVLLGVAPQFRPNLILLLPAFALITMAGRPRRRRALQALVLLACGAAALAPWVIRNYRLTGLVLPTSVHGGIQLWYGTLEVGPYLNSRPYNPRSVFESPAFPYTSLADVPLIVTAHQRGCIETPPDAVSLIVWTDAQPVHQVLAPIEQKSGRYTFEIPAAHGPASVYYYFETQWTAEGIHRSVTTPAEGAEAPRIYFVSEDHLGDLDRHGDLLDIFDVVHLVRHEAWGESLPFEARLAAAGVRTAEDAVNILWPEGGGAKGHVTLSSDERTARLTLPRGSSLRIPRSWTGKLSDVDFDGEGAGILMLASRRMAVVGREEPRLSHEEICAQVEEISVNDVFFRTEPHLMRRYSALALDNIRREPVAFAAAAAYRAVRLFVIYGSDDRMLTHQFSGSSTVYRAAALVSGVYLLMFVAGIAIAWRRGYRIGEPLLLILYVPATISFVLTNMRYSVTVQPLVFMFVAVTLTALAERAGLMAAGTDRSGPAGQIQPRRQ